jgi:hypothetical protein
MRKRMIQEDESRANIPDMQLSDDDSHLVDHIHHLIKDWQALPKKDQEPYLNVPSEHAKHPIPSVLNRYQVRLTHQIVRNQYPNLKTQGMGSFVQITNPTAQAQEDEKVIREKKRELEISNAIGFRWIMEAIMGGDISKLPHHYVVAGHPPEQTPKDVQEFISRLQKKLRKQTRAVVGHNCLTDVINLYRCFIGDLPEKVEEFCTRLQELFPVVIDTKFIAGLGNPRYLDTSLQAVESDLASVDVPQIHLPTEFLRYAYSSSYHEAGFDSLVTAKIGLKIPGKLKRQHKDIKVLVQKFVPDKEETSQPKTQETQSAAGADSTGAGANETPGVASSIMDIIKDPVTAVKSLLTGTPENTKLKVSDSAASKPVLLPASVMPTTGAVIAAKEKGQRTTVVKGELQKLRDVSKKVNIYDLLEDEPEVEAPQIDERQRIADLVKEGKLMPQWEEDAEFWKLIANKLQANATQEGILDLTRR